MDIQTESYKKNDCLYLKVLHSKETKPVILRDAKNIFLKKFIQKEYTATAYFEKAEEAYHDLYQGAVKTLQYSELKEIMFELSETNSNCQDILSSLNKYGLFESNRPEKTQ